MLEAVTVTGYKDADVLFAFNSRGFGGEVGMDIHFLVSINWRLLNEPNHK